MRDFVVLLYYFNRKRCGAEVALLLSFTGIVPIDAAGNYPVDAAGNAPAVPDN